MDDSPHKTSPSALRRFNECPRRFWFQDVRGLRGDERPGAGLATGRAVHDALARSFRLPAGRRGPDAFEVALRSVWHRYRKPYPFYSLLDEKEWGERAIRMVREYAERADLMVVPAAIERTLSAELPDGQCITGRVDRVDPLNDGSLAVIDYKTGNTVLDHDDMRLDPAARLYVLLVEQRIGPVSEIRFEYLASGETVVWRPERDDLSFLVEAVAADIDGIWMRRDYDAVPGRHCAWCPFSSICADGWAVLQAAA